MDKRFRTPAGFTRAGLAKGSFGGYLRSLPLLPEGAPVVDFRGHTVREGHDPNVAGVVDLDVGDKDLQHCADAIIRLHAEWRYARGERDLTYRAVSGQPLVYRDYLAGERAVVAESGLVFQRSAAARKEDHAVFRSWLDEVFAYAGTASVERDGKKVSPDEMTAGDFFVLRGSPVGHAVLILDIATDDQGRTALLLGQSYMPAQSFQILAPGKGSPWFIVEPGAGSVATPFWRPFPMTSLRRL